MGCSIHGQAILSTQIICFFVLFVQGHIVSTVAGFCLFSILFSSSKGITVIAVVLFMMPMTCFHIHLIWRQATLPPGGSFIWYVHTLSVSITLTAQDLHYPETNSQTPVQTEPDFSGKATSLARPQEGEDVMEGGRGWYLVRIGQLGEGGNRASCLFNIFILISALGTQRRIHPENWIISLRWVKHT